MENLDLQQLEWLFYGLLGLILLIVAMLIVYVVVSSRRRKEMGRRAQAESTPPPTTIRRSTVTLVRAEDSGALVVEVGGARYRRLADIPDHQVRQDVLTAAVDLIRFTGAVGEETLSPLPLERATSWREDARAEGNRWRERARAERARAATQAPAQVEPQETSEAEFLRSLAETDADSPSLTPPTLIGAIRSRMKGKPADGEQSISFVEDIDRIVQRRLLLVPALAGRDLRMYLTPEGTVCFRFEGQDYAGLEDVPNLTARQLVQDAIQEWDETT